MGFVRGAVLEKLLAWYMWRKEVCCCLSKIFLWFVPQAASLNLSASVANPKKLFYVRKTLFYVGFSFFPFNCYNKCSIDKMMIF